MTESAAQLADEIHTTLLGINSQAYVDDDQEAQDVAGLNSRLSTIYASSADAADRAERLLELLNP